MNEFSPQQDIQLNLEIVEQGVLFLFHHPTGGPGDLSVEDCVFSGEETERILKMLEGLPGWN